MTHGPDIAHHGGDKAAKGMPFAPWLAAVAATGIAFIFGLAATLSWQQCLLVVLGSGALAGGSVFTFLEMHRLGKRRE
jgi:hypothetical protein